ncbi:MAG: nickel-responsive transcriptional regulator NikR [Haloferacaceae archaeon]
MTEDIERMSVTLPSGLLAELEQVVDGEAYASRSEATRDALRSFLTDYRRENDLAGVQRGAVVVMYDHDVSGVNDEILDLQHEHPDTIVATQHVHLSGHLCMETLVVDGPGQDIEALLDALRPLKGVHQVRLAVVEAE